MPVVFCYEKLMEEISGNGRYQAVLLALALLTFLPGAFLNTGSVFLAGLPKSRCKVEFLSHETHESENDIKKTFIPWNSATKDYDRCLWYNYNLSQCQTNRTLSCAVAASRSLKKTLFAEKCNKYFFEKEPFENTVVMEWNLVCEQLTLGSLSTSAFFLGLLVGAFVGGALSDRFGRVAVMRASAFLTVLSGIAIAFSQNVYVFGFLRFLMAVLSMPLYGAAVVYGSEIAKQSWRVYVGTLSNSAFGIGCIIMSAMAQHWRKWRPLQIAFSIGLIPCVFSTLLMPKSPRWLFSRHRTNEAEVVLTTMAKRNGTKLSPATLEELSSLSVHMSHHKSTAIKELLKRPCSRYILFCSCFIWAINSMVFYGLALNSGGLGGNVYLNHAIGGIMECMACITVIPIMSRVGRKSATVAFLTTSSISCLLSTICIYLGAEGTGFQTAALVLVMAGRFTASATFALNYQYTLELFPTPGRFDLCTLWQDQHSIRKTSKILHTLPSKD